MLGSFLALSTAYAQQATINIKSGTYMRVNNHQIKTGNLVVNVNGTLTQSGGSLNISQGLTVHGTLTGTGSRVQFEQSGHKFLSGSGTISLQSLVVNGSAATDELNINRNLTIDHALTLTMGKVVVGNGSVLTFGSSVSTLNVNEGSADCFVEGKMAKIMDSDATSFVFPLGKNGTWAPVGITTSGGAANATTFEVEYFTSGYGQTSMTGDLKSVSDKQYWQINRTTGNRNARITLHWKKDIGVANTSVEREGLRVAHWDGAQWEVAGDSRLAHGVTGSRTSGQVTSDIMGSFSPFTIGSTNNQNALPVSLLSFTAHKEGFGRARLKWATASEKNNKGFDIEKSKDGILFEKIGFVPGKGNSQTVVNYQTTDHAFNAPAYYRLKQTDNDGTIDYSKIVYLEQLAPVTFKVFPNPVQQQVNIVLSGENIHPETSVKMLLGTLNGQQVWHGEATLRQLQSHLNQKIPGLVQGIYLLQVVTANKKYTIKLVKQR